MSRKRLPMDVQSWRKRREGGYLWEVAFRDYAGGSLSGSPLVFGGALFAEGRNDPEALWWQTDCFYERQLCAQGSLYRIGSLSSR